MTQQYESNIAVNPFKSLLFSYYNRKFITPQILSYNSFRIWYSFTIDEFCSFDLLLYLEIYASKNVYSYTDLLVLGV